MRRWIETRLVRQTEWIWKLIPKTILHSLIQAFVHCTLDYCNSALAGVAKIYIQKLKSAQRGRWNCKYWKMQVWKIEVQKGKMCKGGKCKCWSTEKASVRFRFTSLREFGRSYVMAFLRHWADTYRMSCGLANELLVTWDVPVTPDWCFAQDLVLSRHNRFSVMHIYVALWIPVLSLDVLVWNILLNSTQLNVNLRTQVNTSLSASIYQN